MRRPWFLHRAITFEQAAAALSAATREIRRTQRRRRGDLVTTRDGQTYLIVPADRPDATGRVGVMWDRQPGSALLAARLPTYAKSSRNGVRPATAAVAHREAAPGSVVGPGAAQSHRRSIPWRRPSTTGVTA